MYKKKLIITKKKFKTLIKKHKNIYELAKELNRCKSTIQTLAKKFNIKFPKKYHHTGKKIGRSRGFKLTQDQINWMKDNFKGKGNPFYGKKHTEETKRKMSRNHKDFKGDNNPFRKACLRNPKIAEDVGTRAKERWLKLSKKEKEKIIERLSLINAKSSQYYKYKNHLHGHHFSKKMKRKFFFRSSWEKTFCEILDELDFVISWSLESLVINYKLNKKNRYTRIDFLVEFSNGKKFLFEVKPKKLIKFNLKKINGMKKYCTENNIIFKLVSNNVFIVRREKTWKPNLRNFLNECYSS